MKSLRYTFYGVVVFCAILRDNGLLGQLTWFFHGPVTTFLALVPVFQVATPATFRTLQARMHPYKP